MKKIHINDQGEEPKMLFPCDCKNYNGGQCYNCLNGVHSICEVGCNQGEPGNEAKKEVGKCVECGAYTGHSVNCSLIDLEEAKKQLKQYYDLWLTREMWVRKRGNMWRTQAEKWKGKFFEVKNENNKLRKKLPTKPLK